MKKATTISEFLMQSWARVATQKSGEEKLPETKMDEVWLKLQKNNPLEFVKQGISMAAKELGINIDPYKNITDSVLDKLIEKEIEKIICKRQKD